MKPLRCKKCSVIPKTIRNKNSWSFECHCGSRQTVIIVDGLEEEKKTKAHAVELYNAMKRDGVI